MNSNTQTPSLLPRPFTRRRKGLIHTAHMCAEVCAEVSIATGCIIVRRFCMMCSSMDNKWRVYDRIPPLYSLAHAHTVCQALSPPFPCTRLTNTILFLTHTYTQNCVLYLIYQIKYSVFDISNQIFSI